MPVQWTDDLATGIDEIDAQHKDLYLQVAALHASMRTGHVGELAGTLRFLERYALEHFAGEEQAMELAAYPALPEHRRLHQRFVEDLLAQKAALTSSPSLSGVVAFSQWLTGWLGDHVRRVDREMARHLRRRGGGGQDQGDRPAGGGA